MAQKNPTAEATETPIETVLNQTDDVDALDEIQVKDAWARGQFMHAIIKAHGPAWMRTDECEQVQKRLANYENSGLKEVAVRTLGRTHSLTQSLGWENGPGNVETLFDRLTTDDKTDSELVEVAREQLKEALRGTGMPRISVMRERVRYHSEVAENGGEAQ